MDLCMVMHGWALKWMMPDLPMIPPDPNGQNGNFHGENAFTAPEA
jgi:hypothetical protein